MQDKILDYRVIIEPEKYPNGSTVYVAYCPTLGISDYGDNIESVLASLKDGIELAIESLVKDGQEIPTDDTQDQIITTTRVSIPSGLNARFAA